MHQSEITELLGATRHKDAKVRRAAIIQLCPCRMRKNHVAVWDRLIELHADADVGVRSIVLHNLCDGSPHDREAEIISVVETLATDSNLRLRRRARNALAEFRRIGTINVE